MEERNSACETTNKVVLIGNQDVGKTTIFSRFKTGRFVSNTEQTKVAAEHCKEVTTESGRRIEVSLFDTAGMERYTYTIPPTYFRHAKVVLLVYSFDNVESLTDLEDWVTNFHATRIGNESTDIVRVLVGNKSDVKTDDSMSRLAVGVAANCEVPEDLMFEISAMKGDGFDDMFQKIAEKVSQPDTGSKTQTSTAIRVTKNDSNNKKPASGCCKKS